MSFLVWREEPWAGSSEGQFCRFLFIQLSTYKTHLFILILKLINLESVNKLLLHINRGKKQILNVGLGSLDSYPVS